MPQAEKKMFVLKNIFNDVSKIQEGEWKFSEEEWHFGVPWSISIDKSNSFMTVYLHCLEASNQDWSIDVNFEGKLISSELNEFSKKDKLCFNKTCKCSGSSQFKRWSEVEKEFVMNDKLHVEVHVEILKIKGTSKRRLRNFDESTKEFSDAVIMVEKKEPFPCTKFVLKHYFNDISKMKEGDEVRSETAEHFGIPWTIEIRKREYMEVYLFCLEASKDDWSIGVDFEVKLISPELKEFSRKSQNCFNKPFGYGWPQFKAWSEVEKEFVKDDQLHVEIHVEILNVQGLNSFNLGKEEFYISKLYLACQSSYFSNLFSKNSEKKDIFELENVYSREFQNYLEVLYGKDPIDDNTVEPLLKLGKRFSTPLVTEKCEKFLISSDSELTIRNKLRLSEEYQLEYLKIQTLSKINTLSEIQDVLPIDYENMDSSILALLLRKTLNL